MTFNINNNDQNTLSPLMTRFFNINNMDFDFLKKNLVFPQFANSSYFEVFGHFAPCKVIYLDLKELKKVSFQLAPDKLMNYG